EFLVPAVRPLFDDYLQRLRTNSTDSGLMRLLAKDGTERIWSYRNIRYDEPGSPPCVLGHGLDVTQQEAAEHALRESRKALAAARLGVRTGGFAGLAVGHLFQGRRAGAPQRFPDGTAQRCGGPGAGRVASRYRSFNWRRSLAIGIRRGANGASAAQRPAQCAP